MHKARVLLILGIWVAVLPYLGFPSSWKNILFNLTGLGLIFFSYTIFKESEVNKLPGETFDNFSENKFEGELKGEEEQH